MARSRGSSRSALPDPRPPFLRLGWAIETCLHPELSVFRAMLVGFGLLRVDAACREWTGAVSRDDQRDLPAGASVALARPGVAAVGKLSEWNPCTVASQTTRS
jgi:hypothetical protein